MTDQVNQPIKTAEDLFKSLIWDNLVSAALVYAKIDFWPLNSICRFLTNQLYEFFRLQFDLATIVFLNTVHKAEFDKACVTLKVIGQDYGPDSSQYKVAKDNAKDALSKFVRFGAAS